MATTATTARQRSALLVGLAHAANTVGFQIAAAMLGGASLASGFGLIADRFGLETLGTFLLVAALLLAAVFEILERHTAARAAASG